MSKQPEPTRDRYGRKWLRLDLCDECGQPRVDDECTHLPLSPSAVRHLNGRAQER